MAPKVKEMGACCTGSISVSETHGAVVAQTESPGTLQTNANINIDGVVKAGDGIIAGTSELDTDAIAGLFSSSVSNVMPTVWIRNNANAAGTTIMLKCVNATSAVIFQVAQVNGVAAISLAPLPISNPGPNILWNDGGTLKVGT